MPSWLDKQWAAAFSKRLGKALRRAVLLGSLIVVGIVVGYAWKWHSLVDFFVALDPVSAANTCRGPDGHPIVFCDFANHYYPQGQTILATGKPMVGFFYPASFALVMKLFAGFSYSTGLVLWVAVGLVCSFVLLLLPQIDGFPRSRVLPAIYGLLVATALPILHNFIWGQVSVLVTGLTLIALVLYQRERRFFAGVSLATAVSVKLYPAIFVIYFLIRRDVRTLVVFVTATLVFTVAIPSVVLGVDGMAIYYRLLERNLVQLDQFAATSPYSNNIANVASTLITGQIVPTSITFGFFRIVGFVLMGGNAILLYLLLRTKVKYEAYWVAALTFTMIPFAVGTSWVHYFVYLPLVQAFLFMLVAEIPRPIGFKTVLCIILLVPSAMLSSLFFFVRFDRPDDYYRHSYPFWSNLLLLPALYLLAVQRLRAGHLVHTRTQCRWPQVARGDRV